MGVPICYGKAGERLKVNISRRRELRKEWRLKVRGMDDRPGGDAQPVTLSGLFPFRDFFVN